MVLGRHRCAIQFFFSFCFSVICFTWKRAKYLYCWTVLFLVIEKKFVFYWSYISIDQFSYWSDIWHNIIFVLWNCDRITLINLTSRLPCLTISAMVVGRNRCAIQFFLCLLFSFHERGHHCLILLYSIITVQTLILNSFINDQTLA